MPATLLGRTDSRLHALPGGFWAVDTETTLFHNEEYRGAAGRKSTRVSPHTSGMRLVLGSVAGNGRCAVYHRDELVLFVGQLLEGGASLIFHNAAFDYHVLTEHAPWLRSDFIKAIRAGRIHCTRTFEQLIRIARGSVLEQINRNTKLSDLAFRYAGMKLDKEGTERLTYGEYEHRKDVPEAHLEYALQDAIATYLVYAAQRPKAILAARKECRYKAIPGAEEKFGILAERNHVMGDIALFWLQRHPIRVDKPAVAGALKKLGAEARRLEDALCSWTENMPVKRKRKAGDVFVDVDVPWAKRNRAGQTKLAHKVLRRVLAAWAEKHGIVPDLTNTGEVSLERDFWSEHIPRLRPMLAAAPELADLAELTDQLSVWMAYTRLRLMETRYLVSLATSERHYPNYWNIGARTTRTSASRFPIQQTPKRRDGIRGLFIPEPGNVFIEADYRAAELTALAQVYHLLYGRSALGDAINEGQDPHDATARRLFPESENRGESQSPRSESPGTIGDLRQACKAINFGLPGGMGPAKFSLFARGYGLRLSLEEARHLRRRALQADPELARYLFDSGTPEGRVKQAAENLGLQWPELVGRLRAWRNRVEGRVHWRAALKRLLYWSRDPASTDYELPLRPGFRPSFDLWRSPSRSPSGSIRGRASFTEAHNFPFQAAVADVGKIALFNLYAISTFSAEDWSPVCFIHDSIMIQVPDDRDEILSARLDLKSSMLRAIEEICPDIHGAVDVETKPRWGELGGIFSAADE